MGRSLHGTWCMHGGVAILIFSTFSFHVNSSTGEIYLSTTIDREETPGPLMFTVIASDLDSNITQRNEDTTSVTIYGNSVTGNISYIVF